MLFVISFVIAVLVLYVTGVMVKIAVIDEKTTTRHREDFDHIAREVEKYRQLHRGTTKETNAFAFDGLWYRLNKN